MRTRLRLVLVLVFASLIATTGVSLAQEGIKSGIPAPRVFISADIQAPGSNALTQDSVGQIWIGTEEGLFRYDGETTTAMYKGSDKNSLPSSFVQALQSTDAGVWVGTAAGLRVVSPVSRVVRALDDEELSTTGVVSIDLDSKGRLWVALDSGAMRRIGADGKAESFRLAPEDKLLRSAAENKKGRIWIGSNQGVHELVDDRDLVPLPVPEAGVLGPAGDEIRDILFDVENLMWVAASSGLYRRNADGDFIQITDAPMNCLAVDDTGHVWAGSNLGAYQQIDNLKFQDHHVSDIPKSLPHEWVRALYLDSGGLLWLGTGSGITKYSSFAAQLGHRITPAPGATFALEYHDGSLWVMSMNAYAALHHFDWETNTVTTYKELPAPSAGSDEVDEESEPIVLTENWVTGMLEGKDGTLWISTNESGVIGFRPSDNKTWLFDEERGLPSNFATGLVALEDSRLYVSTIAGLAEINLDDGEVRHILPERIPALYTLQRDPKSPNVLWLASAEEGLLRLDLATNDIESWTHDEASDASLSSNEILSLAVSPNAVWAGTYSAGLNRLDLAKKTITRYGAAEGLKNQTVYSLAYGADKRIWIGTNGAGLGVLDPKEGTIRHYGVAEGAAKAEFAQNSAVAAPSGLLYFASGKRGFNRFDPRKLSDDSYAPAPIFRDLLVENESIPMPAAGTVLSLSYDTTSLDLRFSAPSYASDGLRKYQYRLVGQHNWIETDSGRAVYTSLPPGEFDFEVRAANKDGIWSKPTKLVRIFMPKPPWLRWWAFIIYGGVLVGLFLIYRAYQQQRIRALEQANRLQTVENDLELSSAIQSACLPPDDRLASNSVALQGFYRPADVCGGDWWWYERADGYTTIYVGDVTGHGVGPAMVTASVASMVRVLGDNLKNRLQQINEEVMRVGHNRFHMTMSIFRVHEATGTYEIYSAGGLPPITQNSSGKPRVLAVRGTPLGSKDFHVGVAEGKLEEGTRILLMTDGLVEMKTSETKLWGLRRFSNELSQKRQLAVADAVQELVTKADSLRYGVQDDDWTLVMLDWAKGSQVAQGRSTAPIESARPQ